MAPPRRLEDSVRERSDLPDGPVVVALSGGADSSVLAWVAAASPDTARAVFVDHGLAASAGLRAAAEQVAAVLGMGLDVVQAPVSRNVPSFEDAARRARYEALLHAAKPEETVVTGHTADDQAETVLGHFLRGAGAAGLAGIPEHRDGVSRPLLRVTRAETRALAVQLGLPFSDDPENDSLEPRRNRLRSELIPQLEQQYNPQLRSALLRTSSVLAADDSVLEAQAAGIPVVGDGEAVAIPRAALAVVPRAVGARAVRRAIRELRGPHGGTLDEVTAVLDVAAGARAAAELSGALRVEREGPVVVLSGPPLEPAAPAGVAAPEELMFDRWWLRLTVSDTARRPRPLGARVLIGDAGVIGPDLTVGPAATAGRIDIGTGTKKVADALAESGVPRRLRARWPVLMAGSRVVMIPGIRLARWASPSSLTSRYLETQIDEATERD